MIALNRILLDEGFGRLGVKYGHLVPHGFFEHIGFKPDQVSTQVLSIFVVGHYEIVCYNSTIVP